ncbi:PDR/VanB family oxidoreductase [Komagataeibacter intermedius]|uniref:Vanillate O-demethylase oxidoreductase n=2 Tax=Komagataeibacter intermedius TaxID=66229 RepID=A0A0N1FJ39_9PROT|nr:PDR/VanB family oxidoreductase [Komagataeibacter intermedius]KPH85660.1 vanillate O-demethylase oxidoreductase [Komagataeibacter intermedius AF2]MCF3637622.1 PDR/VanB family oxidoreductase [Komagataeibacter intermedius]GAN88701.1 vanillate O-demethylase oxidoreductase [Komagataeibacter intermedius TF2]GBQ69730.1 flavodoxin reductase [Komagataeibacter intermedius NRIC 0521]
MSSLFPVHVDDVAPEGTECVRLRLVARPGDDALPAFEPGAHVDVMTPSGLIRQYSLCGSADDPSAYLLCIRREADSRGGSQSLCTQVRPGMELQISTPRNAFSLPVARRYVLVGGGIGVTPLLSMMMRLQRDNADWQLHFYARDPERAPFREMLDASPYREHVHFSQSPRSGGYPAVLDSPDPDTAIMLCGPDGFMNAVFAHAVAAGWGTGQIHTEYFRPTDSTHALSDRPFEVVLARSGQTVPVPAGQSIASALLAAGVDVALSCEQGMCGACVVPLLAGDGDHRDMVLTEEEQGGSIALCCSRSRSPSLTLDL